MEPMMLELGAISEETSRIWDWLGELGTGGLLLYALWKYVRPWLDERFEKQVAGLTEQRDYDRAQRALDRQDMKECQAMVKELGADVRRLADSISQGKVDN